MRNFWLLLSILWLWTCSGGDKASGPEEPPIVVNLTSLGGQAQKGPFNNGTAINVAELTNTLSPTGRNFSSAITDNSGRFAVANVQLESPYVELRANGYYFNEVSNEISTGQLTLFALSNLTGKTSLNVNILTHLEKNRIVTLMSGVNPKTFAQAKLQAQEEVFAIFDYSRANVPESELLDISQGGAANAKLLAISAIIQGDLAVGQMSQLLANISTDIASDGTLDDTNLRNTLIENSKNLDMAEVRSNLVAHYTSLGIAATIPDFESEVNQFLKPPVVQDIDLSVDEDNTINITLTGSDPEGESITFSIVDNTDNATLTLNGNVVNYTPNTHFNGTDTFTYKANDGTSDSNTGTVTITVNAVDDEPNTIDVTATTDEDNAVDVSLSAEEYDGDSYSFAIITDVSNGTTSLNGSTVTYTPNQDFNGEDSFTFEATDDTGRTMNVATATITVNAVNDAPFAPDMTIDMLEDGTGQFIISSAASDANFFRINGTDIENDALTFQTISVNNATYDLVDNNNELVYYPNQDFNGQDTFQYTLTDGTDESNAGKITVNIAGVNDAPTTVNFSVSTDEDIGIYSIPITEYSADVENDILVYIVTQIPTNGNLCQDGGAVCGTVIAVGDTIVGENGTISSQPVYEPNQDFNGSDSFSWKVNDEEYDSNISTVTISVNPINDAPVSLDTSISTRENVPVAVTFSASDVDGDNLSYSILTQPTGGVLTSGDNINFVYTPNTGFIGSDSFTYVATDGTTNSNTSTVSVTVISGSAPIAVPGNLNIVYSTGVTEYTTDLSSLVTDPDGDPMTFYINSEPDIGSATIDGSIVTYTIDESQIGNVYTTSMTFYANDGANNSNVETLNIRVDYSLGGYIVDISEFDHDAYTSNFSTGLRTADVSYLGDSNAGTTGFFIGNKSGEINTKRYDRDFDRFDYWQDEYSVELNFNETSLAWDYISENIVGFVPFSIYIIHNETGNRIRLFAGIWDEDESGSWTINTNPSYPVEPVYGYNYYETIYAYVPTDINAPYDPNMISQYSSDNDLNTSGGCGWASGGCNFPDDYLPGDDYIHYPFITELLVAHKDVSNVSFSMTTPTASNHTGLNTGYTTGSAIFFKTERNNSRESSKNRGPIFIESTRDDDIDSYDNIFK